ncbi:probable transcriptional regulator SLK2 [Salvia splendens]|uniref:probable transcriptional regulator SLK2 n=1 Tax=Salvia splendens TaxID=180675 RepID=UPI001C25911A|nr:probable transcriptional regulator SLK2 [Salvia splendens]XP_042057502.1 probable transcriptional regulator SLK2 [Salvia splendens]
MVPPRVAVGTAQLSSSSGVFFRGDEQGQFPGNSQLSSNFGNSLSSLPGPFSGDVSNIVLNSLASSGPSVGASSLVTDANSGLSGGHNLQRSASVNTESYMRLPASPMSFSSNNISISGSSVIDGSSVVQQSSNQDSVSQQSQQHHGVSSATSLPRTGQLQFPGGASVQGSFALDQATMSQLQKKPRLDIRQEDIAQQQVLRQLLQRQDFMHLQNSNPQLQALIQQQRLRQQEQLILQAMSPMQRVQLLQQQQQLQSRQQLQIQGMPSSTAVQPNDGGVCSRRLMQYLYHHRQRPADNTIVYWRNFVAEFYSPRAKKRWCLSLYNSVGQHSLGVFPQAAMDAWQCDICGSKSGRGFEATFEVLPRLEEIKFASGVIDELLFLDLPRESKFPSGIMMLEYEKAVQESVYEQLRVVREGHLCILFTPDLKILSWEFCARRHEELLPRRVVASQVNRLLQVAQKCQSTIAESGADGVSHQDLQANSAMVITAGLQLARSLELQSVNDLGFSKRHVRCLQIADVVNSMKDLMDFCRDQKKSPIEGLNSFFPRCSSVSRVQMTDHNTLNKLMALHPGLNNQLPGSRGALTGSAHGGLAMTNYQNLLMRQNSMNSTNSINQHEGSSSSVPTTPGSSGAFLGMLQNPQIGSQAPQKQQSQPLLSQNNQTLQHQMLQQFLHDMNRKNNGGAAAQIQNPDSMSNAQPQPPIRGNSFKDASFKSESPASVSHMGYGHDQKSSYFPESLRSSVEIVPDIAHEFIENGFFNNDLDESMNFSWKG